MWDEYQATQTAPSTEPVAELPDEVADAAQTVDILEQKLEVMAADLQKTLELFDNSREREQASLVELAQVRERLAATEDRLKASEEAAPAAAGGTAKAARRGREIRQCRTKSTTNSTG